ncbi:MAG: hypothetical protein SGI77_26280 [Pirellulaceae bacterium]|nr:hypothetical protein [Pirellulaceae bacterium]
MAQPPLIPSNWQLPDEFRQRLGSTAGRQRFMQSGRDSLIVAHYVPEHNEVGRRGVLFWRDGASEWRSSNGDLGKGAIAIHLSRYSKKLDEYDSMEEKAIRADDYLPILEGVAPIARSIRNLLETLEEARKAIPDDRSIIDHRDKAYELSRQADLLYEDAKNSMDVAVVRRADEQAIASRQMSVAAHRLNMLAALFFPFATLGAIFGTTLTDNWSWRDSAFPFVLFLAVGLIIGGVLAKYISRPA